MLIPEWFEDFINSEPTGVGVLEVREIGNLSSSDFTLQEAGGLIIKILLISVGFTENSCCFLCSLSQLAHNYNQIIIKVLSHQGERYL